MYRGTYPSTIKIHDFDSKTLAELREDIYDLIPSMSPEDKFFSFDPLDHNEERKYLAVSSLAEDLTKACDVTSCSGNKCTLYIGHSDLAPDQMIIGKMLSFTTIDSKGKLKPSQFKVAEFVNKYDVDLVEPLEKVSVSRKNTNSPNQPSFIVNLDKKKLKATQEFAEAFDKINRMNLTEHPKAEAFMKILNEYGWYLPVNYTLGLVPQEDIKTQESPKSEVSIIGKLKTGFRKFFGLDSGEASNENTQVEVSSVGVESSTSRDVIRPTQKGSNWEIVEHEELVPTLLLLGPSYERTLNEIVRIFRRVYFKKSIKSMQPNVDVYAYVDTVSWKIQRIWS